MPPTPPSRILTVRDLSALVKELDPDTVVVLSRDAEGSRFAPWTHYGLSDGALQPAASAGAPAVRLVVLYPE